MKKRIALLLCACLILSAAGCSAAPAETDPQGETTAPNVIITSPTQPYQDEVTEISQPMHALIMPTVSEATLSDDGTVLFSRSYQKIQLILNGADSADAIAADLQNRIGTSLANASQIESYAKDDYAGPEGWNPYFIDLTYTPTRIDKAVISLFGNHSSYSGGNHPALVTESVTYDLSTGKALTLANILVEDYSGEDLSALISTTLSPKADKLSHNYEETLQSIFSVNLNYITNWYFSRTGLCFHFAPYIIAPYASGTIIAEIPYTTLADVVKEQFLPAEQPKASGSIYAEFYIEDDSERFTSLSHIELSSTGTQVLLYPDANVTDVRIETGSWSSDETTYIPVSTVFAADVVGLGNAIVIHADFSDNAPVLRLNYRSGDQEASAFILYDQEGDSIQLAHG